MLTVIEIIIGMIVVIGYYILTQPKKLEPIPFSKADSSKTDSDLSPKEKRFPMTADEIEESLRKSEVLIQEKLPTTRRLKKTELSYDNDGDTITPHKLFTQRGKGAFMKSQTAPRTDFPLEKDE